MGEARVQCDMCNHNITLRRPGSHAVEAVRHLNNRKECNNNSFHPTILLEVLQFVASGMPWTLWTRHDSSAYTCSQPPRDPIYRKFLACELHCFSDHYSTSMRCSLHLLSYLSKLSLSFFQIISSRTTRDNRLMISPSELHVLSATHSLTIMHYTSTSKKHDRLSLFSAFPFLYKIPYQVYGTFLYAFLGAIFSHARLGICHLRRQDFIILFAFTPRDNATGALPLMISLLKDLELCYCWCC